MTSKINNRRNFLKLSGATALSYQASIFNSNVEAQARLTNGILNAVAPDNFKKFLLLLIFEVIFISRFYIMEKQIIKNFDYLYM